MKKYFLYELKKSAFTIACLAAICTIIYLISILSTDVRDLGMSDTYTRLFIVSACGGILAFCIPFRQFDYKMKKRSADLFFALPFSHTKILTVKYLVGLIIVFAPYTAAYIIGALAVIMRATYHTILPQYYPLHFLASIIPIYVIYAVSAFAYTRAGKATDGALNAICWATVLAVIAFVICLLTQHKRTDQYENIYFIQYIQYEKYFVFMPLSDCTEYLAEHLANMKLAYGYNLIDTVNTAVGFSLSGLMGIGATVGLFMFERKAKFEDIEQISKSPFGLTVMLPLFTVCISALCADTIELFIIFAIAAFLVTAYYKRTLKIGNKQAIILAVSLVAGLIIGVIAYYA
ncbi:MAG: hypothetical protein K2L12_01810 [Clostridia bacterium]|nr:hypothetical protein [Clostridia bacterium]